jgi:hypothetical protein
MVKSKPMFFVFVFLVTFGLINQVTVKKLADTELSQITLEGDHAYAGPIWDWFSKMFFNKVKSKILGVPGWVAWTWFTNCVDGVNTCQVQTSIFVENWKVEQDLGQCSESNGRAYLSVVRNRLKSQGINNQVYYLGSTGKGFRYGIGKY